MTVEAWLSEALERLSDSPLAQGTLAAACTFILEDPTTLGCALLVADGKMLYGTAMIGLALGIGFGDWALYALGRFVGPKTVTWGLVSKRRLDHIGAWFERNLVATIFVSRFVPGLRLPANLAAGMSHASPVRYLPVALLASLVWTFLALSAISKLGEAVLPMLGTFKWPLSIALVLSVVLLQRRSWRHMQLDPEIGAAEESPVSFFEFWHPVVFYAPVAGYYAWLSLKYRSLTLPTAANPSIYSGGMIRESKSEILDMLPPETRGWAAPHVLFKVPGEETPLDEVLRLAEETLEQAGIALPIVAKPDEGQRGVGVRPIYHREQFQRYLQDFPRGVPLCLQELVSAKEEVGLLYHRLPSEENGRISSVTSKHFPSVTGDGVLSLRDLIARDDRASYMQELFFRRHAGELGRVLGVGEVFPLVFAGNHKQGCVFRDGKELLRPELEARIDEIAKSLPDFYFGRFDIRYADLEALQRGEDFKIVEINGAGAEATHIWDPRANLMESYRTLFEQFRTLFEIGAANRAAGHRPLGPVRFLRDVIVYHRVARDYPLAD